MQRGLADAGFRHDNQFEMKTNPQDQLSTLIGDIYDVSLSTDRWPTLLQRLSETLAEAGISLFVRDLKAEEVPNPSADIMDPELAEAGEKYHLTIKVSSAQPAQSATGEGIAGDKVHAPGGDLVHAAGESLAPPESIVLGCFISRDKPAGSLVAIQYSEKRDPAAPWDAAMLRRLAPHLRRAFDLHKQYLTLNVQRAATIRVLDHLPVGVLLVDPRGRVLTMNTCAKAMVAEADGLAVDRSGVRADSRQETATLRALIRAAADAGNGENGDASGALSLSRPSMRRPFWALVTSLRGHLADEEATPAIVALFVSDPERQYQVPAEVLERFFGLTPAEIRLLEALVNGMSLEDAADEFQLSKNTLRTQLHQIFRKTQTSRQAEVIKLVLSSAMQMNAGPVEAK